MPSAQTPFRLNVNVAKTATVGDQNLVFGWANVVKTAEGAYVVDSHGEIIPEAVLEKAVYEYVENSRRADRMHGRDYEGSDVTGKRGVGHLVECMVFTTEKLALLGIEGKLPVGAWVGLRVNDAETYEKVKSGELSMFSIGGMGTSVPMSEMDGVDPLELTVVSKALETAGYEARDPKVITSLKLSETSLVDKGANPGSIVMLTKRAVEKMGEGEDAKTFNQVMASRELEEKTWKAYDAIWTSLHSIIYGADPSDAGALISQTGKEFAAFTSALSGTEIDLRTKEQQMPADMQTQDAPAIDISKVADLPAEKRAELIKTLGGVPADEVSKAQKEVDAAKSALEKAEAMNTSLTSRIEKIEDERAQEAMQKHVEKTMSAVAGVEIPDLATALRVVKAKCGDDVLGTIEKAISTTAALVKTSDAMVEQGTDVGDIAASAYETIAAKATAMVRESDGKIDLSEAMEKVMEGDPALAEAYYVEQKTKRMNKV